MAADSPDAGYTVGVTVIAGVAATATTAVVPGEVATSEDGAAVSGVPLTVWMLRERLM